ncbi:hypothetical protein C9374_008793 [Naegleria lovaniensis]|uniref:Uncharacterized protein n=1 Tax=Naegleria lovaniensis TaxID=51637 RepID=A0AA88GKB8_NAELO|nr:uncharacterized protein C9374_008793 [Naegleria lovaniensis]KAG2377708.1 hypothetical protein C9374_008793 [Naegleria lovaniensis]
MGFEFRRFKEISKEEFSQYHQENQRVMESKDDIYFLILHQSNQTDRSNHHELFCSVGIKLAHSNSFEIKLRIKRKKSGIEQWKKFHGTLQQPLNLQHLDRKTLLDGVVKLLNDQTQYQSYFTDDPNKYTILPVYVKKIRKTSYCYEHAFFSLRFDEPQGNNLSDKEWYFESVNIEGYKKKKQIPKDLLNRHFSEQQDSDASAQILTMGYPELIYTWWYRNNSVGTTDE